MAKKEARQTPSVRLIPLGGVGEIGKNSLLVDVAGDLLLIDAGVMFPPEDLPGVDLIIPDFTYLIDRAKNLKAILITHAHEDHIGALPFLLKQLGRRVPVYGLPLTLGLVDAKLKEHGADRFAELIQVSLDSPLQLGRFSIQYVPISHSVPDSASILLDCDVGKIFFTGDFKFDQTPIQGEPPDLDRLREIGNSGVMALLSDCVRVERPGVTPSEKVVGAALDRIVRDAAGRVIITTFASNIIRLQQAIEIAHRYGRRVAVVGRSMEQNLAVASSLGYLPVPPDVLVTVDQLKRLPPSEAMILTTGSQGEPTAVLSRIAMGDHPLVKVVPGDTIVISATAIPGNEETISHTIDNLMRRGARVLYPPVEPDIHVSGHASRDELRALLLLLRPTFAIPVHGEYRQMVHYRDLAMETGMSSERVALIDVGNVLDITPTQCRVVDRVRSGGVLVDGLTVGGVTQVVLRDRRHLAADGVVIASVALDRDTGRVLSGPDVTARGFIAPAASSVLEAGAANIRQVLKRRPDGEVEYAFVNAKIKEVLGQAIYRETRLRPMILPVITQV